MADPLSHTLSLLKPTAYMAGGVEHRPDWCFRFPASEGIKFFAVVSGECWLLADGGPGPIKMQSGACVLLPHGRGFQMASNLSLPSADASTIYLRPLDGGILCHEGGGGCLELGAHFSFTGGDPGILLDVLPPVVSIQSDSDKAALRLYLEEMMHELRIQEPGGHLLAQQFAYAVLVKALRLHLAQGSQAGVGWLSALADKQMSAALHVIHDDPGHNWNLEDLARVAGMSRSLFASRFKVTVGLGAIEYLTRWRMQIAADRLRNSNDSVLLIAMSLGYVSESAFGKAFKRFSGYSPRRYNQSHLGGAMSKRLPQKEVATFA